MQALIDCHATHVAEMQNDMGALRQRALQHRRKLMERDEQAASLTQALKTTQTDLSVGPGDRILCCRTRDGC